MKKIIYILFLLVLTHSASSQVWIEGFTFYSNPMEDWMASGNRIINIDGHDPVTIPESDIFQTFADPQFGGGANFRYVKNKLVIGLEISYVGYKTSTLVDAVRMFRLEPIIEYHFFSESKFHPYVGGQWGLQTSKVTYSGDIIDAPKLAETHIGIGPRAGIVYTFSTNWAFRLGAKYVYLQKLPYLDITAGIALNIGDF